MMQMNPNNGMGMNQMGMMGGMGMGLDQMNMSMNNSNSMSNQFMMNQMAMMQMGLPTNMMFSQGLRGSSSNSAQGSQSAQSSQPPNPQGQDSFQGQGSNMGPNNNEELTLLANYNTLTQNKFLQEKNTLLQRLAMAGVDPAQFQQRTASIEHMQAEALLGGEIKPVTP